MKLFKISWTEEVHKQIKIKALSKADAQEIWEDFDYATDDEELMFEDVDLDSVEIDEI